MKKLIIFICLICFFIGTCGRDDENKDTAPITQTEQTENTAAADKQSSNPEIQEIMNVTNLNETQAQNINNILAQCGIDKYSIHKDSSMDNLHGLNEKSYIVGYKNYPEIILLILPDGSIYRLICKGEILYNGDNQQVEKNINDVRKSDKSSVASKLFN